MPQALRAFVVFALIAAMATGNPTPTTPTTSTFVPDWPFDVLKLKNGTVAKGLVLEETRAGVRFRIVRRIPGRPTIQFTTLFTPPEISRLEKLSDADRVILKAKLEEIDPSPQAEAQRLERIDVRSIEWPRKGNKGLRYESDFFTLESDAPEEIVRRVAYRLENVYAAYSRFMPTRFRGGAPTAIHLHATQAGYQKSLPAGLMLQNPAFYDPVANRISCGTELQRLGDDLARFRTDAKQKLDELADQEAKLIKLYGKKPELTRHLQPIRDSRATIERAARENEATFDRTTRQVFQTLYHEAFHAYVGCFVFPRDHKGDSPGELPRWLNEGMAQVFETAVFEAGELRIGHADRARVEKSQELLNRKEFAPMRGLLNAPPNAFAIQHAGQRFDADRAYTAAWAMAANLMFERRLLGTSSLDDFVKAIDSKAEPIRAFEGMVGQPLADYERDFHAWLKTIKANGTLVETPKE